MRFKAILHLGSNLGKRRRNLMKAIELLNNHIDIQLQSSLYETKAWGNEEQADFLNQALLVETDFSAIQLLDFCLDVTSQFPKKESETWGPRNIDIDIIFFNDEIIDTDRLKIPHPRLHLRNFVLIPLLEIVPDWIHPEFQKTVEELYIESKDLLEVILVDED